MVKKNKGSEFEELRIEAESLQHEEDSPGTVSQAGTATQENDTPSTGVDESDESDLNSQLTELVEVLEQELKDTNPMTLLIVFALGILIGRLLPK
jgi:hypothetical protein